MAGIVLAIVLDKLTEYFTSTHFSPVKETSRAVADGLGHHYPLGPGAGYGVERLGR